MTKLEMTEIIMAAKAAKATTRHVAWA